MNSVWFKIIFLATGLAMSSCAAEEEGLTMEVEPAKMQAVLLDLHRTQVESDRTEKWRADIFTEHSVDSSKFHSTLRFFAVYPDSAQVIYEWVQDKLSEERENILAKEREKYN